MSFTNPSGALYPFHEVVPDGASHGGLTKSSILTQRRRARITPQTGSSYGSAGTGGANSQIQFLLADQGGLIDPRSICVNFAIQTASSTTTATAPDDGHPFNVVQILLNGQLLDNIQSAMKLQNIEMKMGGSKTYYQTAGSFQGFELLNPDLTTTTALGSTNVTPAMMPQWGYVVQNLADISARTSRSANVLWNNIAGEFRSVPLGLISGVGRMKNYIPVAVLGELVFTMITGSYNDVLIQNSSNLDGTYSLSQVNMTYDVVVPDSRYADLLKKMATEGEGHGLTLPFESSIVTTGGTISGNSSASLIESSVIVSRATNHLLRTSVVQIPSTLLSSQAYPAQSCFSHAGTYSVQWRVGSQTYPLIAAQGDADLFTTSLSAYGSVEQTNGSCVNRVLWGNSSNATTAGTPASYETSQVASGGSVKFYLADSFIPSYGFAVVKGDAEPLDVDGISLAGASGSQLITTIVSAPYVSYTPYVSLVALKFIRARGGVVSVEGA